MTKEVIVIGGGVIGLCSAYYLQKEGHHVTIIDQSNLDSGASYVNAGYLSPSHIIPLSAPGVIKKSLKWMFNASSPLHIKPSLNLDFIKWALAFNKSCTVNHVKKSAPIIRDISVLSQELYNDIKTSKNFSYHYEKKGLLMLCQTEKVLEDEIKMVHIVQNLGLEALEVTVREINELEPNVEINAIGGVYFKCDHHSTPREFMTEMKTYLKQVGVKFCINEKAEDIELKSDKILTVITKNKKYKADEYVLAAGSWSSILSKKLGLKLLMQAGKGYRINTQQQTGITIPAIMAESKAAVTPMNGFTRFAGTMEISEINHVINKVRVEAIAMAVTRYYPNIKLTKAEKDSAACGLRPVSPDGLPYIGKSLKCNNLTIATGHAMMGWSMATGTGKLVSEIISDKDPSLKLDTFHPDRKF